LQQHVQKVANLERNSPEKHGKVFLSIAVIPELDIEGSGPLFGVEYYRDLYCLAVTYHAMPHIMLQMGYKCSVKENQLRSFCIMHE
jgi:hypothetical protein